jgi:flagellar biosynthesis protein FlhG
VTLFMPRLTAVGSGKGGTGKTFVSLSLAESFAERGERVLLCDADLGLANVPVRLGLASGGDLPGLVAGRTAFKSAVVHVTEPGGGFDLLSAPPGTGRLADGGEKAAERLLAILLGSGYQRIVIDLAAGVTCGTMTIAAAADEALAVVTPDPAAITDAYAFVKLMAKRTGGRMPGIVVNRAADAAEAKRTAEALSQAARSFLGGAPDYLGWVPEDVRVGKAARRQKALASLYPQSAAAAAAAALAGKFAAPPLPLRSAPSLR